MSRAEQRRAKRKADKAYNIAMGTAAIEWLARWPNGSPPMNCGPMSAAWLILAAGHGWAVQTREVDRLGALIWRITDKGRERLAQREEAACENDVKEQLTVEL